MNLKIVGEKIIVKIKKRTQTDAGIILPDIAVEKPYTGEVVGIGNYIPESTGCQEIKIGDIIRWLHYAGEEVKIDGEEFLLIRPNDVIGVYPKQVQT